MTQLELDDYNFFPPPGLSIYETETKLTKLVNMKLELEEKLFNINKLIEEESIHILEKPTPEFKNAIYSLLSKESPIRSSSILYKLSKDVLPPLSYTGLFTSWMNQIPNIKKEYIKDDTQEYYSLFCPVLEYYNAPQINNLPVVTHHKTKYKVPSNTKVKNPLQKLP